jgi:hypothetical protein
LGFLVFKNHLATLPFRATIADQKKPISEKSENRNDLPSRQAG